MQWPLIWRSTAERAHAMSVAEMRDEARTQLLNLRNEHDKNVAQIREHHATTQKSLTDTLAVLQPLACLAVKAVLRIVYERALTEGVFPAWPSHLEVLKAILARNIVWEFRGTEWRIQLKEVEHNANGTGRTEHFVEVRLYENNLMVLETVCTDGRWEPAGSALWVSLDASKVWQGPVAGQSTRQPDDTWKVDY